MKKITLKNLIGSISSGFLTSVDARNLKVANLKAGDVLFEESNVEGLEFERCQFRKLAFHGCFVNKVKFTDCLIKRIEVDGNLITQQFVGSGMLCLGHNISNCLAILLDDNLVPKFQRPKCANNHRQIPNSEIAVIFVTP